MKRILLLALIALTTISAFADDHNFRRIDNPQFDFRVRNQFEIKAIELSDTATVLEYRWNYSRGSWMCNESDCFLRDDKGRTYKILRLENDYGITLDDHHFHDNGELIVRKVYPPLPDDVKWVDVTSVGDASWCTFGIRVDGTPAPKMLVPKTEKLPEIKYEYGIAEVRGHIMDYHEGMIPYIQMEEHAYVWGGSCHNDTLKAKIQPNGDFSFRVPVTHITPKYIGYGSIPKALAYLAPGEVTEVYLNLKACQQDTRNAPRAYITRGPLADVATEINQYAETLDQFRGGYSYRDFSLPLDSMENLFSKFKEILNDSWYGKDFYRHHRFSPVAEQIVKMNLELVALDCFRIYYPDDNFDWDSASEEEKEAFAEKMSKFGAEQSLFIYQQLSNEQYMLSPQFAWLRDMSSTNEMMPDYFDIDRRAHKLEQQIKDAIPFDKEQYEENLKALPKAHQKWLTSLDKELKAKIKASEKDVNKKIRTDLPDVPAEKLYDAFIERYKGKPIYLLCWQPRRDSYKDQFINEVVIPLQKEFKDEDIAWVLLADVKTEDKTRSYEDLWHQQIVDIDGDHYALDHDTYMAVVRCIHNEEYRDYGVSFHRPDGSCVQKEPFFPDIVFERIYLEQALGKR